MKSDDMEKLFKESVQAEETDWASRSQFELQSTVIADKQEWTQISFSQAATHGGEPQQKIFFALALWVAGAVLLVWTIRDLLGF